MNREKAYRRLLSKATQINSMKEEIECAFRDVFTCIPSPNLIVRESFQGNVGKESICWQYEVAPEGVDSGPPYKHYFRFGDALDTMYTAVHRSNGELECSFTNPDPSVDEVRSVRDALYELYVQLYAIKSFAIKANEMIKKEDAGT